MSLRIVAPLCLLANNMWFLRESHQAMGLCTVYGVNLFLSVCNSRAQRIYCTENVVCMCRVQSQDG